MKQDQKGFNLVVVILILVVVGLASFAGWYVWNSRDKTSNSSSVSSPVSETADGENDDLPDGSEETVDAIEEKLTFMDGYFSLALKDWVSETHSTKKFHTTNDEGNVKLECSEQATLKLPRISNEPVNVRTYIFVCDNQDNLSPADFYKKYESIYSRGKPDTDKNETLKLGDHDAYKRFTKNAATTGRDSTYPSITLDYTIKAKDKMVWIYSTYGTNEDFVPKLNEIVNSLDFKD